MLQLQYEKKNEVKLTTSHKVIAEYRRPVRTLELLFVYVLFEATYAV